MLPLQEVWVWSLIWELRSCMPHSTAKKKEIVLMGEPSCVIPWWGVWQMCQWAVSYRREHVCNCPLSQVPSVLPEMRKKWFQMGKGFSDHFPSSISLITQEQLVQLYSQRCRKHMVHARSWAKTPGILSPLSCPQEAHSLDQHWINQQKKTRHVSRKARAPIQEAIWFLA